MWNILYYYSHFPDNLRLFVKLLIPNIVFISETFPMVYFSFESIIKCMKYESIYHFATVTAISMSNLALKSILVTYFILKWNQIMFDIMWFLNKSRGEPTIYDWWASLSANLKWWRWMYPLAFNLWLYLEAFHFINIFIFFGNKFQLLHYLSNSSNSNWQEHWEQDGMKTGMTS